jgi:RNA polymerase sigma factor (sigma-70 family)
MTEDRELLRCYAHDHSNAAFAELVERHIEMIYNTALRRLNGDAHLAEDAVQLVFVDLARKAGALHRHPALLGWLHTSTRYAAAVLARRESRRRARERIAHAMDPDPSPAENIPWETLRPLIDGELDRLGETDRQAVLLRFFGGRSFAEIGAELNVSEEASRKRVARAIEQLRRGLVARGITATGAALATALSAVPVYAVPAHLPPAVTSAATAAAAGGSVFATLTTFMSTIKISGGAVAACSLVGLATLGVGVFSSLSQQHVREREQLAALEAQSRVLQLRIGQLKRVEEGKAKAAAVLAAPPTIEMSPAGEQLAAQRLERQELLLKDAAYAPFREQELRLRVQREFGAFFAERGYSVERIEALTRAFVVMFDAQGKQQLARMSSTSSAARPDPATVADAKLIMEEIKSTLGEDESEQLRRHTLAQQRLLTASAIGLDLADVGHPLTSTQQLALARTMAEARDSATNPDYRQMQREPADSDGLTSLDRWQLDRAKTFLSPAQCTQFENYLRLEHERQAIEARVRG